MSPIDCWMNRQTAILKAEMSPNARVREAYLELASFYDRQVKRYLPNNHVDGCSSTFFKL
jgi:hypothetical protein